MWGLALLCHHVGLPPGLTFEGSCQEDILLEKHQEIFMN